MGDRCKLLKRGQELHDKVSKRSKNSRNSSVYVGENLEWSSRRDEQDFIMSYHNFPAKMEIANGVNVADVATNPTPDMSSEAREKHAVKDSLEAVQLNWARALPLTLTLDMEFDSITDRESFAGDVVEDVSAAAQIDARFVKVVGMRAGSVIADMQIAPEAGDLDQIEQHLVEQVKPTDSALRRGKITSKTIKLARTSSLAGPMASRQPQEECVVAEVESRAVAAADRLGKGEEDKVAKGKCEEARVVEHQCAGPDCVEDNQRLQHIQTRSNASSISPRQQAEGIKGKIQVKCERADGLPKMDTFTQKADPYLVVTVDQVPKIP